MNSFFTRLFVLLGFCVCVSSAIANPYNAPWKNKNSAIVLDAYEYTLLDWEKLKNNDRLAGFINKASDGLPPTPTCGRDTYCRLKWRRYVAAKELYHTRKTLAKTIGLKWGAYHLARPGNPILQAQHFLRFTKPKDDELLALDIEHNDPSRWMSLKDAEIFARYVKARTGRYPVLYTNHATAKFIAANRKTYRLLSRLNLWYARYKADIRNVFPMGSWPSYTVWQFSSMANCNKRRCLRRIAGADNFIDVNVVAMSPAKMRKAWPFNVLTADTSLSSENSESLFVSKTETNASHLAASAASSFLPQRSKSAAVQALKNFTDEDLRNGTAMAVTGRIPVPRWLPEAVAVEKTIIAKPVEIGISSPLVSLSLGPIRPNGEEKLTVASNNGVYVHLPHTLDVLAEPRETMISAEKPLPVDGLLKLFPAEAVLSLRSSSASGEQKLF